MIISDWETTANTLLRNDRNDLDVTFLPIRIPVLLLLSVVLAECPSSSITRDISKQSVGIGVEILARRSNQDDDIGSAPPL